MPLSQCWAAAAAGAAGGIALGLWLGGRQGDDSAIVASQMAAADAAPGDDDGDDGAAPGGRALAPAAAALHTSDEIWDASRSFLFFTIDLLLKPAATMSDVPPLDFNCPRIPIDSVLTIFDRTTGKVAAKLYQGANCKTETCYVREGIWMQPNADFVPVFTERQFLILKQYSRCGQAVRLTRANSESAEGAVQPDRQLGANADAYARPVRFDCPRARGARRLRRATDVVRAGLDCKPLMARTAFSGGRYDCVLEYPIKTVNLNDRHQIFQPDTGPVLFPDLSSEPNDLLATVNLAFLAWNCYEGSPTGGVGAAEFLLRVPTAVGGGGVEVLHYSKAVRVQARSAVFAVD